MPPELLAMTPPTVAASVLAGSGPSLRPYGASAALACPRIVPGRTRARTPPSSTVTPVQWRRTSTSSPSPWACPLRLVPPPRQGAPLPRSRPQRRGAATPAPPRALTHPPGRAGGAGPPPAARGGPRHVEAREVQAGRPRHRLQPREPLEDRVLGVVDDEHGERHVVGDRGPQRLDRVLRRALAEHADHRAAGLGELDADRGGEPEAEAAAGREVVAARPRQAQAGAQRGPARPRLEHRQTRGPGEPRRG